MTSHTEPPPATAAHAEKEIDVTSGPAAGSTPHASAAGGGLQTIWKFSFQIRDTVEIEMPRGALTLYVAPQGPFEQPCLWAMVDPAAPIEVKRFAVRGTGHPLGFDRLDVGWSYVGSFQLLHGDLVFHVFEDRR